MGTLAEVAGTLSSGSVLINLLYTGLKSVQDIQSFLEIVLGMKYGNTGRSGGHFVESLQAAKIVNNVRSNRDMILCHCGCSKSGLEFLGWRRWGLASS